LAATACSPEVSVAKLAQAHGINTNLVFKWRRLYRAGQLGDITSDQSVLLPVTIGRADQARTPRIVTPLFIDRVSMPPDKRARADIASANAAMEIDIAGATIRLRGDVDAAQLRLVLDCLGNSQ
jgi:transposase